MISCSSTSLVNASYHTRKVTSTETWEVGFTRRIWNPMRVLNPYQSRSVALGIFSVCRQVICVAASIPLQSSFLQARANLATTSSGEFLGNWSGVWKG